MPGVGEALGLWHRTGMCSGVLRWGLGTWLGIRVSQRSGQALLLVWSPEITALITPARTPSGAAPGGKVPHHFVAVCRASPGSPQQLAPRQGSPWCAPRGA